MTDTADIDLSAITSPLAITGTLTLAADAVTFGELVQGGPNVVANLGNFDIVLGADQSITFVAPTQVVRNITGDAATSTVAFAFNYADLLASGLTVDFGDGQGPAPGLDLSGYEGISELNVWNTLVQAQNVEQVLALLTGQTVVDINEPPEGFETTVRVVTIQPGVLVDGGLIFEDNRPFWEVTEVDISLLGGVAVNGAVDMSNLALDEAGFETLTLRSSGDLPNTMGDLQATGNNLLDVVVEASQDLEVATVFMTSVDPDGEAALAVTTTAGAEVLIAQVDTNANISDLTISHDGDGTLVIPGTDAGDVGLDLAGADSLTLEGDGAMVFGDWELNNLTAAQTAGIDGNGVLKVLDASGLSGALDLGHVGGLDATDFSLTSGTGLTTLVLHDATLNADEDAGEPGWRFDFSGAAAEMGEGVGAGLDLQQGALSIDLGANTTLVLTEDIDFTGVDLEILQTLDIVVEAGVTVTMTAAQASGLNIVPAADVILDPEDPDYDPADVPVVNIVELGTAAYDLSGVAEGIAGTTRLAADDVTLAEATDLGAFSVTLDDLGAPLAGQTIRFRTEEQAGREIIIDNPAAFDDRGTNVVWLFPTVPPMTQVDTDDYSPELGRLWIPDEVVDGRNVEDLYTSLSSSIIVRVVNTAELDELLFFNGIDRTVEVESFTQLEDGLTFADLNPAVPLEGVVNLTLDLGGQVDIGNLYINNLLTEAVDNPEAVAFQTLTINSLLPVALIPEPQTRDDYSDGYLLPEEFQPGVNPDPTGPNVIGDIGVGLVGNRNQLNNVTINATGVAFEAQTITFEDTVAGATAFFTVTGGEDVTVKSLDSSDPEIVAVNVVNNLTGGATLTVTGGSPGFDGGVANAAVDLGTETLSVTVAEGGLTTFGSAKEAPATGFWAGIYGAELSLITLSGEGSVDLGVIAGVDSADFTIDSDALGGDLTMTLGGADANGPKFPTLAATGTWTIVGNGPDTSLTITEDVKLNAGGTLTLRNLALTIEGDVDDLADLGDGLTLDNVVIDVPAGASLTLTAAQADRVTITGAGAVEILALEATPGADLSGIMTTMAMIWLTLRPGDTGTVTAFVNTADGDDADTDPDTVTLNAALMGVAVIQVSGNGTVQFTGDFVGYDRDNDPETPDDVASVVVGADATAELFANQADGFIASGAGTVAVVGNPDPPPIPHYPADIDLSGLTAATVTAAVDRDTTLGEDADLGTAEVTVGGDVTLTAEASVIDGLTILNATNDDGDVLVGNLRVTANAENDPIAADLSNVETDIRFPATAELGTVTFPTLTTTDNDPAGAGPEDRVQTVFLTAAQADGQTIEGGANGAVVIEKLGSDPVDLSGINVDDAVASVDFFTNVTLDAETDLGDVSVNVQFGSVLTLTGAQANGRSITGDGSVTITDIGATDDLTGIDVNGTLTIEAAEDVTELTVTAAQADGATVEGFGGATLDSVTVTAFEDAPGADLSGVNATAINVELDSTGDVEVANTAVLGTAAVAISGTGTVTVADTASVGTATFTVAAGATLVTTADGSPVGLNQVEGEGTLVVEDLSDQTVSGGATGGATEEIAFTVFSFTEDAAGSTIDNFQIGSNFNRDILDFGDIFAVGDFDDIAAAIDGSANNTGLADILSFSVAALADNAAATVAAAFQVGGAFESGGVDPVSFGTNEEKLFLIDRGAGVDAWHWEDGANGGAANGQVDAVELAGVSVLSGLVATDLADLDNGNFLLG